MRPQPKTKPHKAYVAAAGSLVTLGLAVLPPDTTLWKTLAAVAAVGTVFGVWAKPNPSAAAKNEGGAIVVGLAEICLVVLTVVAVLWWFGVRP